MNNDNQCLTYSELVRIDQFLMQNQQEFLSLTELHGYLTSVISSTIDIAQKKWLDEIFNFQNQQTKDEVNQIKFLILRLYESVSAVLYDDKERLLFVPLFLEKEKIGLYYDAPLGVAAEWLNGYLNGTQFDPTWCNKDINALRMLNAFCASLSNLVNVDNLIKDESGETMNNEQIRERVKEALPAIVIKIFEAFQSLKNSLAN